MRMFDCIVSSVPREPRIIAMLVCALWALSGASVSTLLAEEPIEQLIRQLHQPVAGARIEAAKQLARYGQRATSAVPALVQSLEDDQSDVRLAAAYALGCIPGDTPQILSALIPILTDDDEHVRYSAEWSLARIASGLEVDQDADLRRKLLPLLETAGEHLSSREHQPRHRIAVELAVAKLVKAIEADAPPAPPTQLQPVAEVTANVDLATRVYAASDLIARYQFAEQLRAAESGTEDEKYPDALRRFVIDFESRSGDTRVLKYAIDRWGDRGQTLLSGMLAQMSSRAVLDSADAAVLELIKPTEPIHCNQLIRLAADRQQTVEVRLAALSALSRASSVESQCLDRCVVIIGASDDDTEVRAAAADALARLGHVAAKAEAGLITMLKKSQDQWIRGAVCGALGHIAPSSPAAARAVHEALSATSPDEPSYCEIIDACGCFGALAATSTERLIAGLEHIDEAVRTSAAKSLGLVGQAAASADTNLLKQITSSDELVSVKMEAARALRAIGQSSLNKLVGRLKDAGDVAQLEHSLRALMVADLQNGQASNECIALLSDERMPTRVRAAAATALGTMGKAGGRATATLVRLCESKQADELRAASLIALARIDPRAARKPIDQCGEENSILMRASRAFAIALCGEQRQGFDGLVALLDGSDTDWVIEQAISDIGDVAHPWLIEMALDTSATDLQRLAGFRLGYSVDAASRAALLPCLVDADLGEEFAFNVDVQWSDDAETMSSVLAMLRRDDLQPAARARLAGLLTPDGLGAGGAEDDWQGLALTQPSAIDALSAVELSQSESAPSVLNDMGAGQPLDADAAMHPGGAAIRPAVPMRATAPASDNATKAARQPHLVKVFYGTNRKRVETDHTHHELAVSVLATAGGSLLAMILCLVGFLRSGNRAFAVVALLAIGVVAPFGYLAANKYSRTSQHAPVAYGVDYQPRVELGVCEVSIPPDHEPGMLEGPNIFALEIKQDVNRHVVLTDVAELSHQQFYNSLHGTMSEKGKNVLVFIHGYNVSFDDAARRTAQMALDLKFPGAPVFYSWPSQANWYGYAVDKENIQQSVAQIKSFLLDLASKSGADTINLVAHSMGNVGLTQALKEMEAVSPQPLFNQVVLAAPDIDAAVFKTGIAPHIVTKAHHVTLYTSQTDLALLASRYFNRGTRLGDSASGALLYPGIDTIDATDVDSSLLGHSYYGSNVTVLTDLARVLENQPVASRRYLRAIVDAALPYWAFDPVRISQVSDTPATTGTQR